MNCKLFLTIASLFWSVTMLGQVDLEISVIIASTNQGLSGIVVQLQNEAIGYQDQGSTNAQGKITFSGLSLAGNYTAMVAETDEYYESRTTRIELRSNFKSSVNLVLLPRTDFELGEVLISGNATTKINAVSAEVSSTLTRDEVEALPIEGRDITRVLYRLPNVTQATGFYPEAPNVAINGSNALYTNYMIDGLDNNERFLGGQKFRIPVGFTKDVTVLTNNYSTEFGNTGNGIINITTRSGSNDFSGEAFFITRPGPVIDGSSPYAQRDLSGNQVKDGFQRYQSGFAFGGAIQKGKTFYYVDAEQIVDLKDNLLNVPQLGINETVRGLNRFTLLSGKLDHHWSDRFRSSLRTNVGIVNIDRQGGGLDGGVTFPSAGNSQDRNSILLANKNIFVGDNFLSETNLQYSRFRWNYGRADYPNNPNVTVLDPQEQTIAFLGHPGYIFDSQENTLQFQQKFTFALGSNHTLKTGVEIISADHQLFGGGNINGSYTVKVTESQLQALRGVGSSLNVGDIPSDVQVLFYGVELRPTSFGTRQSILSAYVEDQWSASSRLNLSLGLRYDYDNLSKGGATRGDLNNLAPRFSFNYKLSPRSVLRGGVGLFYDKVNYAIYSDALQQNTTDAGYAAQIQELVRLGLLPADTDLDQVLFDGNLGGTAPATYLSGPSYETLQEQRSQVFSNERRILNPNGYDNPLSVQATLGYQYQVDENVLFFVDVMHNQSYNLFRLRNLNSPSAYPLPDPENVVVRSVAEADLTRPVPVYPGGYAVIQGDTVRGVARNVVLTETGGRSSYWSASFNLQKDKGDDAFAYRLIYTLSRLYNDTEDINFRAMDANDFEAEWGPSINDRTHVLNGIAYFYPVRNFSVSTAMLIQSGQPINRIPDALRYGTTDLNGDGRAFADAYVGNSDRFPGESRNSDRLPWSNTFDVGFQYDFVVGEEGKLRLRADIFNLFNEANLSGYSNNATQSNQVQVGAASSGLLVRRNASAPRQFQFTLQYLF